MGNRPATRHGDHGGVLSPAELDFAPRFLAPLDDKELSMSFHDHLIRQEQERRRASAWPQAVRQLSWFIRDYLRRTAARSALAIKHDLIRVDRVPLDRLTIYLDGETTTITPLA